MPRSLLQKLEILADAAKYDASCASSGGAKKSLGPSSGAGICHAYTPDGRCISLLKILLTNFCRYDCAYCVSRRSSNVERARFTVEEVVTLTLDLYRRNCIEGLFLSSGIARNEDSTMEDLVRVAKSLRLDHGFRGYIHLKTIPGANEILISEAGLYADRLSMNVEMPDERLLRSLAPEKDTTSIKKGLAGIRSRIDQVSEANKTTPGTIGRAKPMPFAPAGQSTQIVVGVAREEDMSILRSSASYYASYKLRRVYYSAFSPTDHPSPLLSRLQTPLMREHRLYQADWLMRFYGFSLADLELAAPSGMLDLSIDPKLAWALGSRASFPVDVNRACREQLLRVPGLGTRAVDRIIASRRHGKLRYADVARMCRTISRARAFIATPDHHPRGLLDCDALRRTLTEKPVQLPLFQ
jgi:putative DNA modification/repair radical SAM protein